MKIKTETDAFSDCTRCGHPRGYHHISGEACFAGVYTAKNCNCKGYIFTPGGKGKMEHAKGADRKTPCITDSRGVTIKKKQQINGKEPLGYIRGKNDKYPEPVLFGGGFDG